LLVLLAVKFLPFAQQSSTALPFIVYCCCLEEKPEGQACAMVDEKRTNRNDVQGRGIP